MTSVPEVNDTEQWHGSKKLDVTLFSYSFPRLWPLNGKHAEAGSDCLRIVRLHANAVARYERVRLRIDDQAASFVRCHFDPLQSGHVSERLQYVAAKLYLWAARILHAYGNSNISRANFITLKLMIGIYAYLVHPPYRGKALRSKFRD